MTSIGLPGLRFCRELAGLPESRVKEDRKVFHEDVEDEKFMARFGSQAQQLLGKVEETGFVGGLIVGLAITLTWVTVAGRR